MTTITLHLTPAQAGQLHRLIDEAVAQHAGPRGTDYDLLEQVQEKLNEARCGGGGETSQQARRFLDSVKDGE